jgi:hypothetical protein
VKIKPKNWATFQHYKNRRPPWIKLHHILLDDYKFQCLPDASRALAPCLWLLASESADGEIELNYGEIGFRVHKSPAWVKGAVKPLIDIGLFDSASTVLAECKQVAILETETETETETEKRHKPSTGVEAVLKLPPYISQNLWNDFVEMRTRCRSKPTRRASEILLRKLEGLRAEGEDITAVLEQSIANSWKGVFPVHKNNGNGRREGPHEQLERVSAELISERRSGRMGGNGNGTHQRSKPKLLPASDV